MFIKLAMTYTQKLLANREIIAYIHIVAASHHGPNFQHIKCIFKHTNVDQQRVKR